MAQFKRFSCTPSPPHPRISGDSCFFGLSVLRDVNAAIVVVGTVVAEELNIFRLFCRFCVTFTALLLLSLSVSVCLSLFLSVCLSLFAFLSPYPSLSIPCLRARTKTPRNLTPKTTLN